MKHSGWFIPTLYTNRLLLRQLEWDDIDDIFQLFSDPEVMKLDGGMTMNERWQAEQFVFQYGHPVWYLKKQWLIWAIVEKETDRLIGSGGFKNWNGREEAEVGLDIIKDCWNKGYGQEALEAMLSFAFGKLGLKKVYAAMLSKNKKALHLVQRMGFQYVGVNNKYPHANQFFNALLFVREKMNIKCSIGDDTGENKKGDESF